MRDLLRRTFLLLAIGAAFCVAPTTDGDELPSDENAVRDEWSRYYAQQLPRYRFTLESDPDTPLMVEGKAVLLWHNSVRPGQTHGDVFIWTHRGKAVLVGTIFSYDKPCDAAPSERVVAHGFHSLSTETIVGARDGAPLPTIKGLGIKFERIAGAPSPAQTRPLRRLQMKRLAQQFTASIRDTNVVQRLRMLDKELYRFEAEGADADGAVFAFVSDTDPELIMVIALRPTADGPQWHFGAGRYANVPLELKQGDRVVWEFNGSASRESGYFSQHNVDVQPLTPKIDEVQPEPDL
jgi:hypothetical protein